MGKKDDKKLFDSVPRYEVEQAVKYYNETKSETDYVTAKTKYLMKRVEYEIRILKASNGEKNNLGLGFCMAYNEFYAKETHDFFASEMIKEIFKDTGMSNLEAYLHAKYPDKKPLDAIGSVIGSIADHDVYLGIYIKENRHLLKPIEEQIEEIMKNWDNYVKYEASVIEDITNGFVNYKEECVYTVIELLIYLKHKMNIDVLKEVGIDTDDDILNESEYYQITFNKIDPKEEKVLEEYRKLIEDYIKTKKEPDFYVLTEQAKKNKETKDNPKNKIKKSKSNTDNENK